MKFNLTDRILELDAGRRIVAVKAVSSAEEYLADHFPTFPVLPGVFILEAMVQAAAWLVRASQDFASRVILLDEASNVTYKSFVRPGELLRVDVTCRRLEPAGSEFQGVGWCDDREVVRGRFRLKHLTPTDHPHLSMCTADRLAVASRARFLELTGSMAKPETGPVKGGASLRVEGR